MGARQLDMVNNEKLRFHRHVRTLSGLVTNERHGCHALTETLLVLLSRAKCPDLSCDGFVFSSDIAGTREVKRFSDWLAEKELLDAAYWLSSAYAIWVGEERQQVFAMYFTPPALTNRLLDDIERAGISFANASFLDPACGGAAFLAPIAMRMKVALRQNGMTAKEILEHVESHLFGADLDGLLCRLSTHFLRMVLAPEIVAARFEPNFRVAEANSLTELSALTNRLDVVVCNPPYRKMPAAEVALYRDRFPSVIEAQPNLYTLFIALCVQLVQPDGLIGLVTPTSFMSGQSFSKLRQFLMETSDIHHIGVIADRDGVFINVQQETAITLLNRREPNHLGDSDAEVSIISRDGTTTSVGRCAIPNTGSAWPIPRTVGDAELIQLVGRCQHRLSDYGYKVRIGAFVWNRDKRQTFFTLDEAKQAKVDVVPLLWSSDVRPDVPICFPDRKKAEREPYYIEVSDQGLSSIVRGPAVVLQRVTNNDQKRRLVAAALPREVTRRHGGFIGENHTVILERTSESGFTPDDMAHVLGSGVIDRYFRCISGSTNVSVFELSQLPLPSPARLRQALGKNLNIDDALLEAFRSER